MKVQKSQNSHIRNKRIRKIAGVTAGTAVAASPFLLVLSSLTKPIDVRTLEFLKHKVEYKYQELGPLEEIKQKAIFIMRDTGLIDKNVKIELWNSNMNFKPKMPKPNNFLKKFLLQIKERKIQMYANGLNACYSSKNKKIIISSERNYSAVFHEIGHALNYNSNKFGYVTKRIYSLSKLGAPIIGLACVVIGMIYNKPAENKKTTKKEKFFKFIHDNAGKLSFASFTPVLFEEARASFKGIKLARKYLNESQHILHKRNLLKAFKSYLSYAMFISFFVWLGIKVKDDIVNKSLK